MKTTHECASFISDAYIEAASEYPFEVYVLQIGHESNDDFDHQMIAAATQLMACEAKAIKAQYGLTISRPITNEIHVVLDNDRWGM